MKVVDASALAAVVFDEPAAETVAHRMQGERLVAPSLLWFEVTNVCITKCRRHLADRDDLVRRLDRALRFPIEDMRVDAKAVLALALETRLSAYDANYLWLALNLDAELITLDDALAKAWTAKVN